MNATSALLITADSEQKAYEFSIKAARDLNDQVALADKLRDYYETICDDAGRGLTDPARSVVMSLFHYALQEVDWFEVADHYLGKVAEGAH